MAKKQPETAKQTKQSLLTKISLAVDVEVYELPKDDVIETIPTPSKWLNSQIGGGFCKGYITLLNGAQSSGKTTFVIQTIVHNQQLNPDFRVLFIDAEHAFNVQYAKSLGVNMEMVDVVRTLDMDDIYQMIYAACCDLDKFSKTDKLKNHYQNNYDMIVVDSIDAMVVEADLQNDSMINGRMGLKAASMSTGLKKSLTALSASKTSVVFINQFRETLSSYGSPVTTPGGNAKEYYAYNRIDLHGSTALKAGEKQIGNEVRVLVYKNKNGSPKDKTIWEMYYGRGFDFNSEVLEYADLTGQIIKRGAWFYLVEQEDDKPKETALANGKPAMLKLLSDNPELVQKIYEYEI